MPQHTPLHTFAQRAKSTALALPLALALATGIAGTVTMAPTGAFAQDISEEHLRLGARFAEITGANQLYVNALTAQRRDIIRALASTNPDIGELITEVADLAYVEMAESAGPLFRDIALVYASAYTFEDLQQIVAFFDSEVGGRYVANQRATDQAVLQATVNWGDAVSVEFLSRVRELLAEQGVEL